MLPHTLELHNLSGGYGPVPIIADVTFTLSQGHWLTILGANGSGKSTLLRLISHLLPSTAGTVLLSGRTIHHQPQRQIAQQLAILPQSPPIPEGITVYQLVSLGRTPHQTWWQWELDANGKKQVAAALERTDLWELRDRAIASLSGGQRQRAFLALALAQSAQVLLLDEPTTYLDIRYQLEILELLSQLKRTESLSLVVVLHDINLAARYSDRLALMRQGSLFALGSTADVLTPENLRAVFEVNVSILATPYGPQVIPLPS
ncbi:MAG: ABC transporter ATP-binding protein [Oscillatoriales cyanobacterium SM2_2_1]|nr:ABC transporter ATP-binding protein [Oscillatoriales cyanobacterium SM2_2_1]